MKRSDKRSDWFSGRENFYFLLSERIWVTFDWRETDFCSFYLENKRLVEIGELLSLRWPMGFYINRSSYDKRIFWLSSAWDKQLAIVLILNESYNRNCNCIWSLHGTLEHWCECKPVETCPLTYSRWDTPNVLFWMVMRQYLWYSAFGSLDWFLSRKRAHLNSVHIALGTLHTQSIHKPAAAATTREKNELREF